MEREQRNAIFGQADALRAMQQDGVRTQMGSNIPVNTIPLPSRGLVYSPESALHGVAEVQLKAMTVQEENILTSKALIKKGTVITELIRSCMVNRDISVNDMLSGDRNTLMVAIRSEGYGNEYAIDVKCASCQETSEQMFDLNQFPLKMLDIEPVEAGKNEFPFKLPFSGVDITFRFLTGKDEEDIVAIQESKKKVAKAGATIVDDSLQLQLQYSIVSVNGNRDKLFISNFVRTLQAKDSRALRKHISTSQPGIEMSQDLVCPHCGHTEKEVGMPIGVSFFWPDR